MAGIVDALYQTTVFARSQQMVMNSTTTQWTDAFARRDRRATLITMPEPRPLTVRLSIEGGPIEFTYTTFSGGLPKWASPVLQSVSERWGARPGWDGYQAKPTNPRLVVRLLNILSDLLRDDSLSPHITPLADGGVQAEWHRREQDLEIVVPAEEGATYYYFNNTTRKEEEADLNGNYAHIQDLIGRLS
jgi:hypothetical protein